MIYEFIFLFIFSLSSSSKCLLFYSHSFWFILLLTLYFIHSFTFPRRRLKCFFGKCYCVSAVCLQDSLVKYSWTFFGYILNGFLVFPPETIIMLIKDIFFFLHISLSRLSDFYWRSDGGYISMPIFYLQWCAEKVKYWNITRAPLKIKDKSSSARDEEE